jgi:hypothetical protein
MFFSIFSYTFADDNTIEFENISFIWQLFYYQKNSENIDFLTLNPTFFDSGYRISSINFLENINHNYRSQTNQRIYTNSQGNILSIFGTLLFLSGIVYIGSSMNRQEHEVYNNRWEQQAEEERMYRRIFSENRNFYGNNWFK